MFVQDDVQWADDSNMELFQVDITDNENPSLLLVACYRSDEVDQKSLIHRLLPADTGGVSSVDNSKVSVTNMSLDQVKDVPMDLFDTDESAISGLAKISSKTTLGNPFFLKSFLLTLQDQLLLQYNLGLMRWIWDEEDIVANTQVSANVVDLLSRRMKELDSPVH